MVVLATVAVGFAADLIVINGLPDFGAKYMVLASLGLSAAGDRRCPRGVCGEAEFG